MRNYTEGPWVLADTDKTFIYALSKNDVNVFSCQVQGGYTDEGKRTPEEVKESIARLMCAAPEMLEALENLVNYLETNLEEDIEHGQFGCPEVDQCPMCSARAAVAKAKGEMK